MAATVATLPRVEPGLCRRVDRVPTLLLEEKRRAVRRLVADLVHRARVVEPSVEHDVSDVFRLAQVFERIAIDDIRAIAEMKQKGVTALTWTEEDLNKVRAVAMGIWDEYAKKSPMTKKIIDSQKAWLRELGLIE